MKGKMYNNFMAPVPKPERQRQKHFLKEWREYLNLNQDSAADRIGVTQSKLSRIENNKTPYDQDFLEQAAEAYGVSIASLVMRDPTDQTSIWSIQDQLKKATVEQQRQITDFVEFVLKSGTN